MIACGPVSNLPRNRAVARGVGARARGTGCERLTLTGLPGAAQARMLRTR
jgi:hypothetical protein